jgi:hypothetical protein
MEDAMTVIADFAKCQVIQEANGSYTVMSKNNICLFQSTKPVKAMEYAEWFDGRRK